ncbi:MAG: hypothetical protein GX640_24900 [Fibrobacter sp.]|nr:hypothetical protein [Fibrobacter sp.]
MVTSTNEIHFDIEDLWRFMDAYAAQQQPTAEGTEEITAKEYLQNKYPQMRGHLWNSNELINDDWIAEMMDEFATLHVQQIADKKVSERLREELIAYGKVLRSWGIAIPSDILECSIDEYLKSREK